MGGGGSKPAPAPTIQEDPYPTSVGEKNLAPSLAKACPACQLEVDTSVTTSSVKLTRDFGDVSTAQCKTYQNDYDAVKRKEFSFQDFFAKLQSGVYNRPAADTANGKFCEQIMFDDDTASKINSIEDFDANASKLKSVRIRKVSGGGSFSKDTKASFTLSIPIKLKYVARLAPTNQSVGRMVNKNGKWQWETGVVPGTQTPVYEEMTVSSMTLYHPSPLRIENVQHDAVLSLNDPSEGPGVKSVVLVPLKGSNTGADSEEFFNRIVKHIISVSTPDSVTGMYQRVDIPTGANWNIKSLFSLEQLKSEKSGFARVLDSFYTWSAAPGYARTEVLRTSSVIRYGWKESGQPVRYFMLGEPVNISLTDLSLLTRNLPPTPAEDAIHTVPAGSLMYKQCEGAPQGVKVVERMTNLADSCDPFAQNAAANKDMGYAPMAMLGVVFNILMAFAVLIGAWLAMYAITLNYDYGYRNFSEDTGRVLGTLAKQMSPLLKALRTKKGDAPPTETPEEDANDETPELPKNLPSLPKGLPSLSGLASAFRKS